MPLLRFKDYNIITLRECKKHGPSPRIQSLVHTKSAEQTLSTPMLKVHSRIHVHLYIHEIYVM